MFIFSKKTEGFTVAEVIVSVAIISVLMTVVLFNYSIFNDNLALTSAGQEIASSIKQSQQYGLSVKEATVGLGQFGYAYGVYFDRVVDTTNYYIFVDKDGDRQYDVINGCGSADTECVEKIPIRNKVRISTICDGVACPPIATANMMDITFLRPNPDARIYFTNSAGAIVAGPTNTGKVTLISQKNRTITITIDVTGQVLVQ